MDCIKTQCTAKNCKTSASNLYLLAQHIYDLHMGDITETLNHFSYPERSQLLMYITGMMKKDIAVVVKKDNEYKLHFIECKYFSGEGSIGVRKLTVMKLRDTRLKIRRIS